MQTKLLFYSHDIQNCEKFKEASSQVLLIIYKRNTLIRYNLSIYLSTYFLQEAAEKDPKLFKVLQQDQEGFYNPENYPQNSR